jgi:hypothetical protein
MVVVKKVRSMHLTGDFVPEKIKFPVKLIKKRAFKARVDAWWAKQPHDALLFAYHCKYDSGVNAMAQEWHAAVEGSPTHLARWRALVDVNRDALNKAIDARPADHRLERMARKAAATDYAIELGQLSRKHYRVFESRDGGFSVRAV